MRGYLMFTPSLYYRKIVQPTVEEFRQRPGDIRLAFHACIVTVHIVDYVVMQNPALYEDADTTRRQLRGENTAFGLIDNFAMAAKHCRRSQKTKFHSGQFAFDDGEDAFSEPREGARIGIYAEDEDHDLLVELEAALRFLEGRYPVLLR